MPNLEFSLVDVFSEGPFSGNSVPVFFDAPDLSATQMQIITRELRHFEAVFIQRQPGTRRVSARIFDLIEELPFAGHPIIGAAAALTARNDENVAQNWTFELISKTVTVEVEASRHGYFGWLDQGEPEFFGNVYDRHLIAGAYSLDLEDLDSTLPIEVISTGLRYMVIPVRAEAIARARIHNDVTAVLATYNAQFAVLLDESNVEIRHWNNDGIIEDIATGSAAGVIGAYRLKQLRASGGKVFELKQGRFTGRPSRLHVLPVGTSAACKSVLVGGHVSPTGNGSLVTVPNDSS